VDARVGASSSTTASSLVIGASRNRLSRPGSWTAQTSISSGKNLRHRYADALPPA
jgi:hypothetical protein